MKAFAFAFDSASQAGEFMFMGKLDKRQDIVI